MKQIIHWIKTHTGLLKTLFVIAVSLLLLPNFYQLVKRSHLNS